MACKYLGPHSEPATSLTHISDGEPADNANGEASVKAKPKTKAAKTEKSSTGKAATKTNSKKKAVPDGTPNSLIGQKISLTGALRTLDHATFEQTVEKFGGTFTKKFAGSTLIVLGEKPGPTKLEEITKEGYSTMTEEEFYDRIKAEYAPPAKRAKKE